MATEGNLATEDLLQHLSALELTIQRLDVRRDRGQLDKLLHDEFLEFGRSGRSYDKATILEQLPAEAAPNAMWSQDFEVVELAEGVALLTYRSASIDENHNLFRHSLRASVWLRTEHGWQMRFHQGTVTEPFAKNIDR